MKFEDIAKAFEQKNLPEAEVELTGEVPFDTIAPYRAQALAHIAEHMELPGFRPGKVPPAMAEQKVGEVGILEEAVELFVKDFYPEMVEVLKLDAIGRPDIRVTKLAPNNPVGLVIRTSVYPTIEIPGVWKNLAKDVPAETPLPGSDEEVTKTLESLQKNVAAAAAAKVENPILDAEGKPIDPPLPPLDDVFAKTVGAFETLEQLKEQIKKGITEEKARAARDSRRGKLIDKLLDITPLSVPKIFVESELDKIINQMHEDVQRFGMTYEEYLKRVEKTEEAVRNEFREQATKRAKLQLVLNKLAEEENVVADESAVEAEIAHALQHFPEAKPDLLRIHVMTILRNDKVLQLLEGNESPKNEPATHDHQH
jgi:FKBP-type peptidyl-prolyl cis-trans isomerase (trigger factor)